MERPFNPKFSISKPIFKPKLVDKYHQPQRVIDESLVSKLFLLLNEGNIENITEFITKNRLLINVRNSDGDSPLHIIITSTNIIKEEKLELVKMLLTKGASPVAINKFNITPIHLAAQEQLVDIVKFLLEYKADPNSLDSNNMNALHFAVLGKNIKCPAREEIRDDYLVPKRKTSIVTEEKKIVQEIADSINKLFFEWPVTQRLFKNIFNNINNFDKLYATELTQKKETFLKDIYKTISDKNLTKDEKRTEINTKLIKLSEDIESLFRSEIAEALDDSTKKVTIDNDKIIIKHFNISDIFDKLKNNIATHQNKAIDILNDITTKFSESKDNYNKILVELKELRWLNRLLVIQYKWDGSGNNITYGTTTLTKNMTAITYNDIFGDKIPVSEKDLDNYYKLDDSYNNITDYNLFYKDASINVITRFPDFKMAIYDGSLSDTAQKYVHMTNAEKNKMAVSYNLQFDRDPSLNNSWGKTIPISGRKVFFPYAFKLNASDSTPSTITEEVKMTFLKYPYALSEEINSQLKRLSDDISVISKFIDKNESWNITIHALPSILILFYSTLRNIKVLYDYLKEKKINLEKIGELIVLKYKENMNHPTHANKYMWVYENMLNKIHSSMELYFEILSFVPTIFNSLLLLSNEYNTIVNTMTQLEGTKELEAYYSQWDISQLQFLATEYIGNTNYFSTDLNIFKIKLNSIKTLNDISLNADYITEYLHPILNSKIEFYPNSVRDPIINDLSNNGVQITYPDDYKYRPSNSTKFIDFNPYNSTGISSTGFAINDLSFRNLNYNVTDNNKTLTKKDKNGANIKPLFGNHIQFLKYYIMFYVANTIFDTTNTYSDIGTNITSHSLELPTDKIEKYKTYISSTLDLSLSELQNTDKILLVELMSETFNNYVEFLLNQMSKKIAYESLEQYKLIINDPLLKVSSTDHIPIFQMFASDDTRNILNLGLKSKLTVEDIKNLDDTFDDYQDEALIKEKSNNSSNLIIKMKDNFCLNFDLDLIKLLIENRTSLSQKDNSGKMPINYALEFKNLKLITHLAPDMQYYKDSPIIKSHFIDLLKQTIAELVVEKKYSKFYTKYEAKLVKLFENIPEINTNILSSIEYTIPMYMTLLNSLLFINIINFDYGYTPEKLFNLQNLFGYSSSTSYYGPIIDLVSKGETLTDYSKKIKNSKIQLQLDIINKKLSNYKNTEKYFEIYDDERKLFGESEIDIDGTLLDISQNIHSSEAEINQLKPIVGKSSNLTLGTRDITTLKIKNTSSLYDNLFFTVLNTGIYDASLNIKLYKALWQKYHKEIDPNNYINNIHLKSINGILDNLDNSENIIIFKDLYSIFNNISKDYIECPLEYNHTNPTLVEIMKLITHTTTHTIFNYMYITLTTMMIKHLKTTYPDPMPSNYILEKLKLNLTSEFIKYIFMTLPEKATKIILNIYDGEDDPDRRETLDSIFSKIIVLLNRGPAFIMPTKQESPLIDNIKTYIIPYYINYSKLIVKELFALSNNFFKHLSGIYQMLKIHEKLIN